MFRKITATTLRNMKRIKTPRTWIKIRAQKVLNLPMPSRRANEKLSSTAFRVLKVTPLTMNRRSLNALNWPGRSLRLPRITNITTNKKIAQNYEAIYLQQRLQISPRPTMSHNSLPHRGTARTGNLPRLARLPWL